MTVIAIIQARMGSTRLPGKVMMTLEDKTVLAHVVHRIEKACGIDQIVVATTNNASDDVIEAEVTRLGIQIYRGSELDVLARYYDAATFYKADIIIRITSDCPLLDPLLLNNMLKEFITENENHSRVDYLTNGLVRTYPRGLDIEIFSMAALQKANHEAKLEYQREHVTPYIYQSQDMFRVRNYLSTQNFSHYRWTLDTIEDFEFISNVYNELYKNNNYFTTNDVLELLNQKPWLVDINKHVEQKKIPSQETLNAATK